MITLVKWIFVHLVVDFLFQSSKMVAHKRRLKARSWLLYIHCLLQGALVYLLAPSWDLWQVAAIVTVSHFIIDLWKIYQKNNIVIQPGDIIYVEPIRRPFAEGVREYGPIMSMITSIGTLVVVIISLTRDLSDSN